MIVDRINRAIVRMLQRRAHVDRSSVRVDGTGIQMDRNDNVVWTMPWSTIDRVTAFASAQFIGNRLVLAFETGSEKRLVGEDVLGWDALIEVLPDYLPGSICYAKWAPRVAITAPTDALTVFDRVAADLALMRTPRSRACGDIERFAAHMHAEPRREAR